MTRHINITNYNIPMERNKQRSSFWKLLGPTHLLLYFWKFTFAIYWKKMLPRALCRTKTAEKMTKMAEAHRDIVKVVFSAQNKKFWTKILDAWCSNGLKYDALALDRKAKTYCMCWWWRKVKLSRVPSSSHYLVLWFMHDFDWWLVRDWLTAGSHCVAEVV